MTRATRDGKVGGQRKLPDHHQPQDQDYLVLFGASAGVVQATSDDTRGPMIVNDTVNISAVTNYGVESQDGLRMLMDVIGQDAQRTTVDVDAEEDMTEPLTVERTVERTVPVAIPVERVITVPVPYPVERIVPITSSVERTVEKTIAVTHVVEVPVETNVESVGRKRKVRRVESVEGVPSVGTELPVLSAANSYSSVRNANADDMELVEQEGTRLAAAEEEGEALVCDRSVSQASQRLEASRNAAREMVKYLSIEMQAVVKDHYHEAAGSGRGGQRISLFQKWTRARVVEAFPEVDLPFVFEEFARAASHAKAYWRTYDQRVREYIWTRADVQMRSRIREWEPATATSLSVTAGASSSSSSRVPEDGEHCPALEVGHDWKRGERLGEAKQPGPSGSTSGGRGRGRGRGQRPSMRTRLWSREDSWRSGRRQRQSTLPSSTAVGARRAFPLRKTNYVTRRYNRDAVRRPLQRSGAVSGIRQTYANSQRLAQNFWNEGTTFRDRMPQNSFVSRTRCWFGRRCKFAFCPFQHPAGTRRRVVVQSTGSETHHSRGFFHKPKFLFQQLLAAFGAKGAVWTGKSQKTRTKSSIRPEEMP